MVRIGLLGNCHYTHVALNHMLTEIYHDRGELEVIILNELDSNSILKAESLDYLIVTGYKHTFFHYSLKNLICKFYHKSLRLIILTEARVTPLITHFFTQYDCLIHFIRLNKPYTTIRLRLKDTLFFNMKMNAKCINIRHILTRREICIMKSLYSGIRVRDLCTRLTLSEKTISSHKSSAQEKLQYFKQDLLHHTMLKDALHINFKEAIKANSNDT